MPAAPPGRSGEAQQPAAGPVIDPRRYRRVRRFFARAFLHALVWDFLFAAPLLRWLRPPPVPRWRRIAGGGCATSPWPRRRG